MRRASPHITRFPRHQCQEVDAVMTYAAEGAGKPLRFGDVTAFECASLYEVESGRLVVSLPQPPKMERL